MCTYSYQGRVGRNYTHGHIVRREYCHFVIIIHIRHVTSVLMLSSDAYTNTHFPLFKLLLYILYTNTLSAVDIVILLSLLIFAILRRYQYCHLILI